MYLKAVIKRLFTHSRATTIPASCYNNCNDAMVEAENTGKTPALCQTNSSFEIALSNCQACIIAHSANSSSPSQPSFSQFIDYCINVTNGSSADASQKSLIASQASQASVISSLQNEMSIAASLGLLSSYQSTQIIIKTTSLNPASVATTIAATASAQTTPSSQPNHATIAGAIAGPVSGLLLSSIVCWFLLRRRKRQAAKYTVAIPDEKDGGNFDNKAQLHSDSIDPRFELAAINVEMQELEGCATAKLTMPELPALEPVGSELDLSEGLVEERREAPS